MTKQQFKKIEEEKGFDEAMKVLCAENKVITYDKLIDFTKQLIDKGCINNAINILEVLNEFNEGSKWYHFNYQKTSTPEPLFDIDDIDSFDIFDKEKQIC